MTLIELLVVIIILTTIVAAAIPILAPADDDRRLREASRGLNTFITGAQARAIQLNRPVGIALKRLAQDTGRDEDRAVCLEAFYVEQQQPYAGFDANSRARLAFYTPQNSNWYGGMDSLVLIQFVTRGNGAAMNMDGLPVGWDPDLFPTGMVRPADVIEINGTQYQLLADPADNKVKAKLDNGYFAKDTGKAGNDKATQIVAQAVNDTGQMLHMTHDDFGNEIGTSATTQPPFFTLPASYKVLRQATPTSDQPYQLPEGTAIDLRASGVGSNDYFYWPGENDNAQGVLIMFAPEGRVARVSYSQEPITNPSSESPNFDKSIVDNVYLLIGKRENIPAPLVSGISGDRTLSAADWSQAITEEQRAKLKERINWLRGTSRWVVIGSQSGRIVTVENAFVDPGSIMAKYTDIPYNLEESSEHLRAYQILAAREFTREMSQLGGR